MGVGVDDDWVTVGTASGRFPSFTYPDADWALAGLAVSDTRGLEDTFNRAWQFSLDDWTDPDGRQECDNKPVTILWGAGATATEGDDVILGTAGPDRINGLGGDGSDTFYGGDGFDKCSGNTGRDQAERATCERSPGVESFF